MPSLKEIKTRISSVNSTLKITSAMKMVASAKLHGAQRDISNVQPYESLLSDIMLTFLASEEGDLRSIYTEEREVHNVALLLFTSNTSLCGAFNSNAIKAFIERVNFYRDKGIVIKDVYAFGKKGEAYLRKQGFNPKSFGDIVDHPNYNQGKKIAQTILEDYAKQRIDKVELVYHQFVSVGKQNLLVEQYLPIKNNSINQSAAILGTDYIVEPGRKEVLSELIPKSLYFKIYTSLLSSIASEHAARMIAMQTATDNADKLLQELTLQYNKGRQQAITSELLDIVGGSLA